MKVFYTCKAYDNVISCLIVKLQILTIYKKQRVKLINMWHVYVRSTKFIIIYSNR